MILAYETVDVFTDTAFGGNPLAVVFGAEALSTEAMQAIAREFNYSETTFVLPPKDPAHTAQVRIFSTKREMPFAGHPNVGTAMVLAWRGEVFGKEIGERVLFEEKAGLVPIRIDSRDGKPVGATFTAPQPFEIIPMEIEAAEVAACAGLPIEAIDTRQHAPVIGSVGLPFILAPLTSADALRAARPDRAAFQTSPGVSANGAILFYTRERDEEGETDTLRCRMFAPVRNVAEDPATGSACAALMGFLATRETATGTLRHRLHQGVEMGRPSLLIGEADYRDGACEAVRIGGACVPITRGTLAADCVKPVFKGETS